MSYGVEEVMVGAAARCTNRLRVGSLDELRATLEGLSKAEPRPASNLDLIGHSTRTGHLLRIGKTAIDMLDPTVDRFFRALAADRLLPRLDVTALRLLGCETAVEPTGQRTMRALARTLGVQVLGATKLLLKSHYNEAGFDPAFVHVLIETSQLPDPPRRL
jgi:hypothetical protein